MAGKGDIRSFFGGGDGPAKKKQRVAEAADAKPPIASAPAAVTVDESADSTGDKDAGADAPATATEETDAVDDDDAPVVHSFANLQRNAKKLVHASWYEQLEKQFQRASFSALIKFLAREESRYCPVSIMQTSAHLK